MKNLPLDEGSSTFIQPSWKDCGVAYTAVYSISLSVPSSGGIFIAHLRFKAR